MDTQQYVNRATASSRIGRTVGGGSGRG